MKQRYTVLKAQDADQILIREEGELDKDLFSTQCTVRFEPGVLRDAIAQGAFPAIQLIRSKDFYPTLIVAEKLVAAIQQFFDGGDELVSIDIDDADFLTGRPKPAPVDDDDDADAGDLDDLLDDDDDDADGLDEPFALDDINSAIKVADDDDADIDEAT